jgi:hypothetical protein
MRRTIAQTLLLCVTFLALMSACAKAAPPYELRVENAHGERLRTFYHRGQSFALGAMGQRYQVRVVNHTGGRIEAVVSVDGRDVLTGRPGDFRNQRGYLVEAYGEVVIEGFRQSLSDVAAFRFTSPSDSYSSRMGSPENVGIIGLAVFDERAHEPIAMPAPVDDYAYYGDAEGAPAPSSAPATSGAAGSARADKAAPARASAEASASAPSAEVNSSGSGGERRSRIGTQYGETRRSQVQEVAFERAAPNSPRFVMSVRYDDRAGLVARGIVVDVARPRPAAPPSAFPLSRFAPPPPETACR